MTALRPRLRYYCDVACNMLVWERKHCTNTALFLQQTVMSR
jgi:hypothetical protein